MRIMRKRSYGLIKNVHFDKEHRIFDIQVFIVLVIQIVLCFGIMGYLTVNHEVDNRLRYEYYMKKLNELMK